MADLRNTIAHILEHKQYLVEANEATIQQYVVLPILRALGWDDANLASMEVLPEYAVKGGKVDYALKLGQKLALFIECKRWSEPLERHEDQIVKYAFEAGVRIAGLTNGKIWKFYFSWIEGSPVSERIFCEIDVEDRVNAISDLEKYLLKYNVVSGRAEDDAQIALKEKAEAKNPFNPSPNAISNITDDQLAEKDTNVSPKPDGKWTIARVRNSLSKELRDDHERYSKERRELFYRGIADVLNLIKEEWRLYPKFRKVLCGFFLENKGVMGIKRIFGIILPVHLPHGSSVDRNGKVIGGSLKSTPPRLFVRITEEEAKQLERQCDGCKFCGVEKDKSVDYVYYDIPDNMSDLFPVLKFAYNKHRGS